MAEWTRLFQRGRMKRTRARKCHHCDQLYRPDYRTIDRQEYRAAVACRQASHRIAQQRWWNQPENQDYYRGAHQVRRAASLAEKSIRAIGKGNGRNGPVALQDEVFGATR